MDSTELQAGFDSLHLEATRLAGGLGDLSQRAAVYHHLFEHSGRNHVFPVIAAHGALWARGYFRFGLKLGELLSWQYALSASNRRKKLAALVAFADAFRDVNRRVCIDTYVSYHLVDRFAGHPELERFVPPTLLHALRHIHAARRQGRELPDGAKRAAFESHFLNEQETVVGPSIDAAVASFNWPLLKVVALRPIIRFAFFRRHHFLLFRNFASRQERIANGLRAFDMAAAAGWQQVAASLRTYDILPPAFFANSARHFESLRASILSPA